MFSLKVLATLLLLGQVSQAWLLQFNEVPNCNPQPITEKGGMKENGNSCMMLPGLQYKALGIKDWDPDCRVELWQSPTCTKPYDAGDDFKPLLNVTIQEAKTRMDVMWNDSGIACFRNLRGGGPQAASYICPEKKEPESEPEPESEFEPEPEATEPEGSQQQHSPPRKPIKGKHGDDGGW